MASKYDVYKGNYVCHTCKDTVYSMRWHYNEKLMTWMCKQGHISEVNLNTKKKKVENEREIGE